MKQHLTSIKYRHVKQNLYSSSEKIAKIEKFQG